VTPGGGISLAANASRRSLEVINVDTGVVTLGFGSLPTAGQGVILNAAATLGTRGDDYYNGISDGVDQRALYAISPTGSHIVVIEGV
jgi:hypothetical protein